jgi:hypothetical protein
VEVETPNSTPTATPASTSIMEGMNDVANQMGDVHVGEEVEDDATRGVRESLEAFVLQ